MNRTRHCLLSLAALFSAAVVACAQQTPRELLVIDTVADHAAIAAAARPGVQAVLLEAGHDPLAQIGAALRAHAPVSALHVVSHGKPGALQLGASIVDAAELSRRADVLHGWRGAFASDADILLYGCRTGEGRQGDAFLSTLAALTGANVAASTDATGASVLGGDWVLEARRGTVRTATPFVAGFDYAGLLPAPKTVSSGSHIYVRPGGTSYTWTFGTGLNAVNNQYYPITNFAYQHIPDFNWQLTRGRIEYSTNNGGTWATYAMTTSPAAVNLVSVSGKLWRFVDTSASNTTSTNSYGTVWQLSGVSGTSTTGGTVYPDNAPTDITADRATVFSTAALSATVATLTPTDTGWTRDGYWSVDSQSVPNLFTIAFDRNATNTATLARGSGTMPAIGQTATVTVRYHDLYQTDDTGNPISGQGFSKTLTFTVVSETSNDLTLGDDIAVNTYTTGNQRGAAMAALSTGNIVIVWQSNEQGGSSYANGIYGQLLSSEGAKVGTEFVVSNAASSINEITPSVAALNNGRFVVAYAVSGATVDIAYRIVEANGTVGSQLIANSTTAGDQYTPSVATLTDESFAIAWSSANGDVRLRRFNASDGTAVAAEVSIVAGVVDGNGNVTAGGYSPSVAALSNGSYAVTWIDFATYMVSTKVAGGSVVSTGIPSSGYGDPRIAALSGGGFVVASESYNSNTNLSQVDVVRYSNAGVLQGSVFAAHTRTNGNRYAAAVAGLSGGGFVVAWTADSDDYELSGVFGRRFASNGNAVDATEFEINQHRADDQSYPALVALANDLFAAAWVNTAASSVTDGSYVGDIEARVLLSVADTTAPTIASITRLSPSGQTIGGSTSSVTFRVTYSEAVQGVGTSDFEIGAVNGGTVTGTITSVTGSGTTRDVTLNLTGGNGEFRLKPMLNNSSI